MKTCTKCGETKPLDAFSRNRRASDGRRPSCRACYNIFQRESRSQKRAATAEVRAERARKRAELEKVRCLHGTCMRPGKDQPEGLGFRFCDIHVHSARKVLDNPTRSWSPAGDALPTKGSA